MNTSSVSFWFWDDVLLTGDCVADSESSLLDDEESELFFGRLNVLWGEDDVL